MQRSVLLAGSTFLAGIALAAVPQVVLGYDDPDPSVERIAVETAAREVTRPIETPRATGVPTYDPSRSLAPLVDAVTPAVAQIEIDGTEQADLGNVPPMMRQFIDPRALQPHELHGEGSGFVISADGLLVTNNHVVEHADHIRARFSDGTVVDATVIGTDPELDIALLQLPKDRTWEFVQLGDSGGARVGDWVVAMGNPLGLGTTVTTGIVSGKGRVLGHDAFDDYLQTDAAINQGNSGGPLFDLDGRVVGINTAIISGANTVGFAIPIDLARSVIDDLRDDGHVARGFMGVQSEPAGKGEGGARVAQIYPDTPASKAGLQTGDLIRSVDGAAVADPTMLVKTIAGHKPGDVVKLAVTRGTDDIDIAVTLSERPTEPQKR